MASLHQIIDISYYTAKYNLNYFIETGTGNGETLEIVKDLNFKLIQSCEIEKIQYEKLKQKFSSNKIKLWLGNSAENLKLMTNEIDGPALIFLDAHFPGAGYIRQEFKTDHYSILETLPLEKELQIILNWKYGKDSVIVVDDLRIYKSDNYSAGDFLEREFLFGKLNYEFLYKTLEKTHNLKEVLTNQGAIIYTPNYDYFT